MKAVILQGVSGAGKSTYARTLGGLIVSADDYFMREGERLGTVKALDGVCIRRFMHLVQCRAPLIVVDNTNATVAEIAPYYAIAEAHGYEAQVVRIAFNPARAADRGIHGVSAEKNDRMSRLMLSQDYPRRWNINIRSGQ